MKTVAIVVDHSSKLCWMAKGKSHNSKAAIKKLDSVARQERQKHLHDICFGPNTRSNTLANVPGQPSTLCPTLTPTSHTAISSFVCSVNTASTRSKNFQTIPASTAPAARTPGGELTNLVKASRGDPWLTGTRLMLPRAHQ